MAIDNRNKRFSISMDDEPVALPSANNNIDEGDRLHLIGLYSGLEAPGGPENPQLRTGGQKLVMDII